MKRFRGTRSLVRMVARGVARAALVAVWALAGAPLTAELPGDWRDETVLNPASLQGTGAEFYELPRAPAASDGAGHWVAAWTWLQPPPYTALQRVCVSRSADDGASWTAPVLLDEGAQFLPVFSSYAPDFPAVATDGTGAWACAWFTTRVPGLDIGDDSDIVLARSTDNGATWTSPMALHAATATSDTNTDLYPRVAADATGTWLCAWFSYSPPGPTSVGGSYVSLSRSSDGAQTWSAADGW